MSLKSRLLKELATGPKTEKQLKAAMQADAKKVAKALKALTAEDKVAHQKGLYTLPGASVSGQVVEAEMVKIGPSYGFAKPVDGSADIFIPGHSLEGALLHDAVVVMLSQTPRVAGSREGEVLAVTRQHNDMVGVVVKQEGRAVFVPDDMPHAAFAISASADGGAKPGEKVAAQVLERGSRHNEVVVGIVRRFGSAASARQCAKAILYAKGIEKSFPDAVKQEGKAAAKKITKEDVKNRLDLRDEVIFTIDSAHTKDMDDAISAVKTKDGYEIGVHIADVSHYVRPGTKLDEEAYRRGTSIYYGDSVVPMLPRSLSNGICSLNAEEDRLAFSCMMKLDDEGRLLDYQFEKTVIHSRLKGVYEEINQLFDETADAALAEKYGEVMPALLLMREIYEKLAALRATRGSMEIESAEAFFEIDGEGRCVDVQKRVRGVAERLIEEFMLLANTAAAHLARRQGLPFVYRVHAKPSAEKVEGLCQILDAAGVTYKFKDDIPTQLELAGILQETRGTDKEILVHNAVLRSMAKAVYEPQPQGHFGLALQDYAHFTSPIRRYPDLAIHRVLSASSAGASSAELTKRYGRFVADAAEQSTQCEQVAVSVERSCDDCYKAEYMKRFVGQTFEGIIVSVMDFGLYVALPNTVEGLVPAASLSEHKFALQAGVSLTDPVTGHSYRIGQRVKVQLVASDVSSSNIDFTLA